MAAGQRARRASAPVSHEDLTSMRMTLGRIGRMLRQRPEDELSYALMSLLFAIAENEPVTAGELAEIERVTPPSVSRSLSRLESLKFIKRTQDASDGRVTRIRLTAAGRRQREVILRTRDLWLSDALTHLTTEEVKQLVAAVPALARLCDPPLPEPIGQQRQGSRRG